MYIHRRRHFPEKTWLIELRMALILIRVYDVRWGSHSALGIRASSRISTWIDQKITYGIRRLKEGPIPLILLLGRT